jgi:transcriptional regulator with XRE-family HTH domain
MHDPQKYDPVKMLRQCIARDGGTQADLAKDIGISPQFLSEILNGVRKASDVVLDFLGLEKIIVYRPKRRA